MCVVHVAGGVEGADEGDWAPGGGEEGVGCLDDGCQLRFEGQCRITDRHTWSRSENGRQSWKVLLVRKLLKKAGQDGEVKLLPRLLSKGRGKDASADGDAVAMEDALDDPVDDGARLADEASCLAYNPIRGLGGGGLRS